MDPLAARPPPALDRCAACGQASDDSTRCPHCGSSLLVDVLLDPAPREARLVFKAARAAASAGIAGLDFADARAALERMAPIAANLPRDRARALLAALARDGFSGVARGAVSGGLSSHARRSRTLAIAAAAVALVGVASALVALRLRRPEPAALPQPALAPAPVEAAPPPPSPAPSAAPRARSTAELGRMAHPALAVLTCPGRLGSGFFAGPDRVVTNAHVTCGAGSSVDVKLADGRQLIGRVRAFDEWLDFAVVEVPGAQVGSPLVLGDSTALEAGDPIVLVGSPLGLEATVHEGKVSFAARNLNGVAYIQVNADVNPGNSGGPLLDAQGRVVGIVTLRADGASGVGFALPIEYARTALEVAAEDAASSDRWAATLSRVASEDDAEAKRLLARLETPVLLATASRGDRLAVLVMKRWPRGPSPASVSVEVRDGDRVLCEATGEVAEWSALNDQLRELAEQGRARRTVRWMLRRGLSTEAYAGVAELDAAGCPAPAPASAVIALRGAPREEASDYPSHDLAQGRKDSTERAVAAARLAQAEQASAERQWRSTFRELRERIARLEERRRTLRRALETRSDANLVDEARRDLPTVERDLKRAQEDLEDLERRASHASVPREWR